MKVTAAAVLALVLIVIAAASPMDNFFQQGKEGMKQMAGGNQNPMVEAAQQGMDAFNFDECQKEMHDTFDEMVAKGMEEAAEQMMAEFEELKEDPSPEKYAKMMEKYQEMLASQA